MSQTSKTLIHCAVFLSCLCWSFASHSQSLDRGPYLQQRTDSSIIVKWRTTSATSSVVRYGQDESNLNQLSTVSGSRTDHEVVLTGLSTDTRYYYSVGTTGGALAGDTTYNFKSAPAPGSNSATRMWVVGDSGTANSNARAVRDAYKNAYPGSERADMMIMLGDNAYNSGTDSEYQAAVFDTYPEILRQTPVWSALGNHDGYTADSATQSGPYYDIFSFPTAGQNGGIPSGTEAYYSYEYANIHFVVLDSYETDRSTNGAMLTWLENDLATNNKEWLIAFWHHPPYTKGSHDSDSESNLIDMRVNALPILESYGVDLVLSGHSHSYERSYLIDGHYGSSGSFSSANQIDAGDGRPSGNGAYAKPDTVAAGNQGAVYAVAGSSGKLSGGSLNHPAMFISLSQLGSMVIDINDNQMNAEFLNASGQVTDWFTVNKGTVVDAQPPVLLGASATSANDVVLVFDEELEASSANNSLNYSIDSGVVVSAADLAGDNKTVTLSTSSLNLGSSYTVTVNEVSDLAGNVIQANSTTPFSFSATVMREYQNGVAPDTGYSGSEDSTLRSGQASTNYGSSNELLLDGSDGGDDVVSVVRWDISDIPVGSTVTQVGISLGVFNPSGDSYEVYQLLRDWDEGVVSWDTAGTTSWQSGGAQGNGDRNSAVLGTINASSTGTYTVNLNASGLQVVQNWVDGTAPNYGFLLSNLSSSDGVDIHSSESGAPGDRPKLSITYDLPTTTSNLAPSVSAGVDQLIELPSQANLDGTVSDDGLPNPPASLAISWSMVSGPGAVVFTNPSVVDTVASFPVEGAYVLRLTADDGSLVSSDDILITVVPFSNSETRGYQNGVAPSAGYFGTDDSTLRSGQAGTNYGLSNEILLDGSDGGDDVVSVLRWDISDIPAGSTVTEVAISLGVFNPSVDSYEVYQLLRDWDEGAVSWDTAGTTNWQSGGAQSNGDRNPAVLGTINASSTGTYTVNLNVTGLQVVQNWVDGTVPNYGFLLSNLSSSDGVDIHSSESATPSDRPQLSVTFDLPTIPSNSAPNVSAGADQSIELPSQVNLDGTVIDDGLPNPPGSVAISWSAVSGPGTVSFANPNLEDTTASFSVEGTYALRLTADDGGLVSSDDIQITVAPAIPSNTAPNVSAGADQSIALPSQVNLNGAVTDDGLPNPPGSVAISWSTVSGPGTVSFANPNLEDTTASFSVEGSYVLRLTADDGGLVSSDDMQVTVAPTSSGIVHEVGVVSQVSDSWQTVTLTNTYSSMIVIATPVLPSQTSLPVVSRVRNAVGNSFQLKIQNPSNTPVNGYAVHYFVVEEGVYTAALDGVAMEAVRVNSTVTAENGNWNTLESRSYQNNYANPVVVGQVMTESDAQWSVFWAASSGNRVTPPSTSGFSAGKHVAEDPDNTRSDEELGYVVFESGISMLSGTMVEASITSDAIRGTANSSAGYTTPITGLVNPLAAVLSSAAMDGADGGWPVLFGATPLAPSQLTMAIDEDQISNSERSHTTEQVATLVFEVLSNQPPVASVSGNPNFGEAPLQVAFDGSNSSDLDGTIVAWDWDFGDQSNGSGEFVNHLYPNPGFYPVTLTVTDDDGAQTTAAYSIIVIAPSAEIVHETAVIANVTDVWQTVPLANNYSSMVVIATLNLPDQGSAPTIVRIRNASANSFEVSVQNPSGANISGYDVHYLVIEEGVYTASTHGVNLEAVRANSVLTAEDNGWVFEPRSFQGSYTSPVVVGQVMTANDSDWSVFWSSATSSRYGKPSVSGFSAGKHVAEDSNSNRNAETLGYIVVEEGSGVLGTTPFTAGVTSNSILGVDDVSGGSSYIYGNLANPVTALVSSATMKGVNGGWPVLLGSSPLSPLSINLAIDEDQVNDSERNHIAEEVSFIVIGQ